MQTTHGGPANTSPKAELRRRFRALRAAHAAALTPQRRMDDEAALAENVRPLLSIGPVASYAALPDEIDPRAIETGISDLAYPRVTADGLVFHRASYGELVPGVLGIPAPPAAGPTVAPRILLVPLVAATRSGQRLGQGGGYYDRCLAALRRNGPTVAIGLAFDVQVADMLPSDPWDEHLDWLATPMHLVECARNR